MNCKHCGAELEENVTVCPACGEAIEEAAAVEEVILAEEVTPVEETTPVEEEAPAKKVKKPRKPMGKGPKAIIAISLALVLVLGMAAGALYALGFSYDSWENTLFVKNRYTMPDVLAAMATDTVVAKVGDKELTNGVLQLYFGRQLWDLVEEYGDYLTSMGLNLDEPLYKQEFPGGEGATWEQYLISMAIGAWVQQQTLVCMAENEGFQYPDGLTTFLENLEANLNAQAVAYGYKDGNALVQEEMGATTNTTLYKAYSTIYNQSMEYYAALYESMEPDAEQVGKYFDEHAEELTTQYNVTKEAKPVVDVRHILLVPEASVDEATGATTYTEESKAACRQEAEQLLEQWKNGEATEESFAQLASQYTKDTASKSSGGLYEYVYQGDMTENFDAWCFDESRQTGDTGIVETNYGYHIMYFVYGADEWYRLAYQNLCANMCQELIGLGYETYPSEVYFHKIVLSAISF